MIELNNFYIGESVKLMKENIPDNFVDLTVTSPPYDNLRNYNGFVFDYESMLSELYRVTKYGGVVVWVVNDATLNGSETGTSFRQALYAKEIGFNLHDTMIWRKPNPLPLVRCKRYWQAFEYMFVFSKKKPNTCNYIMEECKNAGKKASTFKQISKDTGENIDKNRITKNTKIKMNVCDYTLGQRYTGGHPATFPEKLAEDHIISWSNEGDIVLDPMCGSGTTCKMAYLNNRNFIGIDMSEEYINNICKPRLKEYGWNDKTLDNAL